MSIAEVLPGINELASAYRSASDGANNEDMVRGAILRRVPRLFAYLYFPLILKSYCFIHPPLQWRGGVLQELFKKKGSSSMRSCYRDIMLGSIPTKMCY